MDITIIGTGNMARGIATRALAGGNAVTLVGHDTDSARALAGELSGEVRTGTLGDPINGAVVVLAIPYGAIDDVLGRYDDKLAGKVVIDITNPVDFSTFSLLNVEAGSAAQEIAQKAPGAQVVKAFNTTFASTLVEGQSLGSPLMCSSPPTTTGPRARSARSSRRAASAPSMRDRWLAPTSLRRSAICT